MTEAKLMTMKTRIFAALLLMTFACTLATHSQSAPASAPKETPQETFATPEAAADALIKAASDYDLPALLSMVGPDGKDLVKTADPVRDKNNSQAFGTDARQKHSISINPASPGRATLIVGEREWPLPIPIIKKNGRWIFDSKAGREEVLYRRIGANELDAIQVCRGYVEAQHEYALTIHDDSGVNQYAQKIISTPGSQDGLYWQNASGTPGGPISEPIARAIEEGYKLEKRFSYHGYYFKILKGQGQAAQLGRLDYVIQGAMIGGFALVAAPAEYRVTGVKTFIVNQDGRVYQKDLGPDTLEIASKIDLYNPDKTWQVTYDQWPVDVTEDEAAERNSAE